MDDVVGDVLAKRKALDRGAGAGIAVSLLLHGVIVAAGVYAALHQAPVENTRVVEIKLARPAAPPARVSAPAAPAPKVGGLKPAATQKPKPQPVVETQKPAPPKSVPFSNYGRSTQKGADQPAPAPPAAAAIPVGGTGAAVEGDFPYSIYVDRMRTLIGQHWYRPQVAAGASTTVKFVIERDGAIHDAVIEGESGNGVFDRAALRAVLESSPLPPLPFGYAGTSLGVHLTFK